MASQAAGTLRVLPHVQARVHRRMLFESDDLLPVRGNSVCTRCGLVVQWDDSEQPRAAHGYRDAATPTGSEECTCLSCRGLGCRR